VAARKGESRSLNKAAEELHVAFPRACNVQQLQNQKTHKTMRAPKLRYPTDLPTIIYNLVNYR